MRSSLKEGFFYFLWLIPSLICLSHNKISPLTLNLSIICLSNNYTSYSLYPLVVMKSIAKNEKRHVEWDE